MPRLRKSWGDWPLHGEASGQGSRLYITFLASAEGYARCAVHPEGSIIGPDYEYVLGV